MTIRVQLFSIAIIFAASSGCSSSGGSDALRAAATGLSVAGGDVARIGVPLVNQGVRIAADAERRERGRIAAEKERQRRASLTPRQRAREDAQRARRARQNEKLLAGAALLLLGGGGGAAGSTGGSACGPTISEAQCAYAADRKFATGSPY